MLRRMTKPDIESVRRYFNRVKRERGWDYTRIAREARLATTTITRPMKPDHKGSVRPQTLKAVEKASGVELPADLAAFAGSRSDQPDDFLAYALRITDAVAKGKLHELPHEDQAANIRTVIEILREFAERRRRP